MRDAETCGKAVEVFCHRKEISTVSFHGGRAIYGGLDVTEVEQLKDLERENSRLMKLLADTMLANDVIKEFLSKKACVATTSES